MSLNNIGVAHSHSANAGSLTVRILSASSTTYLMVKLLVMALIGVAACFHANLVKAQTPCASTITTQWFYGTTCYPSQAEAVAAMQSDPANPQNSTLTVMQPPNSMSTGLTQYKYVAPSPFSITNGITVYFAGRGPIFPTQAQALAYIINAIDPPTGCGVTTGVTSGPPMYSSDLGSPSFGPGYYQYYNMTFWSYDVYSNPNCVQVTTGANWSIDWWTSNSCPTYYTLVGTQCVNSSFAYITSTVLTCSKTSPLVGDPCDAASGEYTESERDYAGPVLPFTRYYHSATLESFHNFGVGWTHDYTARLVVTSGVPTGLLRPNGYHDPLIAEGGSVYVSLSGTSIHVQASSPNWIAYLPDGSREVYNASGVLIQLISPGGAITSLNYTSGVLSSVVGPFGHALHFAYNTNNQISVVTDPAGNPITYSYDGNGNLTSALYQDGTSRTYQYTNVGLPNSLTGILDESGAQLVTVAYDSTGRATSSQNAGGANVVSLGYGTTSATATDGLGGSTVFSFVAATGYSPRVTSSAHNGLTTSYVVPPPSVDPQQRATQVTDADGNITTYAYDPDHLTSQTDAYGTSLARATSYQYLSTLSALPTLITESLKQTSIMYYSGTNNIHTRTITDTSVTPNVSRTWTYTYNGFGKWLTVDGPRTDVSDITTATYYSCTTGTQCGQLNTLQNALGQITTYNTYNAHGQPVTVTDPNGTVTTFVYDNRQRLTSSQVATDTTSYSHYPTGLLKTVTLPDASYVTYAYDAAHRVTQITDSIGNYIKYTLDAMGNRTVESTYDPANSLHRTHSRVFNSLNQLYQDVNSAGTAAVTSTYAYDNNGNMTSRNAPLTRNTAYQFDALNRMKQLTDPASGVTHYGYDARDNVISVIDPRTLVTNYTINGFDETTQVASPDSGTSSRTYDLNGNLKTTTDARGAVGTYTYDALNRLKQLSYTDQTINVSYDQGANGIGHLTAASDANHSLAWTYDALGHVTGKTQTIAGVIKSISYVYANGDLTSLVTPSGQAVTYTYNNHRVSSIKINGTTVLSAVTYDPFGPATGWTWGNGTSTSHAYDLDGNPTQIVAAAATSTYTIDNASRISGIADSGSSANSITYGYDALDRLTSGASTAFSGSYTYDADGNTLTSSGTQSFTSTIPATSNKVSSISGADSRNYSYDAAGNMTGYTGSTLAINQRGQVGSRTVSSGVSTYLYDALGQLMNRNGVGGTQYWVHDEAGHIVGQYGSGGSLAQETVWMGDTPIATIRPNGSGIMVYYVHSDHLGSPRKVTRPSDNQLMWRWDPATFGHPYPNQTASGATFLYDLRFPGQLYLGEDSSFRDNGARRYESDTGRYIQSDPIGLAGGINTYSYVGGNPLSGSDPRGLEVRWSGSISSFGATVAFGGQLSKFKLESECKCGIKYTISGFASFLTIGAGAKAGALGEFLADAAATRSSTEFVDPWDECPNPDAANGVAWVSGINVVPGIGGTFLGKLNLGWLQGQAPLAEGPAYGFDISIQSGMGASAVTTVQKASCCSK